MNIPDKITDANANITIGRQDLCNQFPRASSPTAAALIQNNDTHPSVEIDKVTTPGGITIKGINELEHNGFTSAIIKAMKASK